MRCARSPTTFTAERSPSSQIGAQRAMQYGDPDGHGHYGILDVTADGLLCHECGWRGAHLGLHSWKAHGITASAYRERHGLRRSKGLVAADLHQKMSAGSAERLPAALVQARDPQRATSIRLAKKRPVSAEAAADRDRRMAELARASRKGTVVICHECQAAFCPLRAATRRRFCSRSCAAKHNRRVALERRRQQSPGSSCDRSFDAYPMQPEQEKGP